MRTQIQDAFPGLQVPRDLRDALHRAQEGRSPSRLRGLLTARTREEQNLGDMEKVVIMETDLAEVPQKRGKIADGLVCIMEEWNSFKGKTRRRGLSGSWEKTETCQRCLDGWALRIAGLTVGGQSPVHSSVLHSGPTNEDIVTT